MKAFFFDRDGTLNIDPGYINNPDDMKLYPHAAEILMEIKSRGYKIFIISNQSGIGRGRIEPGEYRDVNNRFLSLAGGYDVIDDIVYCPHTPEHKCYCRKPELLLVDIVSEHYDIDYKNSCFVGDKMTDIICGREAGLKTVLVLHGNTLDEVSHIHEYEGVKPDYIIDSISQLLGVVKG